MATEKALCQGAHVLVIDDNRAMLELIGTLLTEEGMQATLVDSAAAARTALAQTPRAFDLVLTDVAMPGESGFELLQWLKREESVYRELPVLLMTSQLPGPADRTRSLAMGAVDYIERPSDLDELVLRTKNAVEHHRRIRSLEASLANSERLATIGRLLAASHHEVKNLAMLVQLASAQTIRVYGELSLPTGSIAREGQRALHALAQSSALLVDVSRSVTSLLEPDALHSSTIDLLPIVRDIQSLMQERVAPVAIEIVDKTSGRALAFGHEVRVKQVLINLILNAADAIADLASPSGGFIRIEIDQGERSILIRVLDDGIGFHTPGERSSFKAFESTKSLRGGQGLGLWLCASLMKNMGGTLSIHSEGPGLGATAHMSLLASTQGNEAADSADLDIEAYLTDLAPL